MKKYSGLALSLVAVLALGACDESPTGDDAGSMSLLITDAPGDFLEAVVTIERVELLRSDEGDDEGEEDEGNRIVLLDEPWTGNLLELSNDVADLTDEITVPGGSYSQLRFIISGGCIEVETEDGSDVYASAGYTECGAADGNLQLTSLPTSGLKVNLPGGFRIDGDHRIVLIDFDVSQSFGHAAGGSGQWVMHPVIHATDVVLSGDIDVTLLVADSVDLPGELTADSFAITIGEEPAVPVIGGVASFDFVVPGTYTVDVVAPAGVTSFTTDPALPIEIEIGSAEDATAEITITSAS